MSEHPGPVDSQRRGIAMGSGGLVSACQSGNGEDNAGADAIVMRG